MSAYRKQWVPPPESRWLKMINWIKKRITQILIISAVFAVGACIVYSFYLNHIEEVEKQAAADKVHRERWDQITKEAKLCEPQFFVRKKLAAHKLWEITCIDEDGNVSHKYVKGDHFIWHWEK